MNHVLTLISPARTGRFRLPERPIQRLVVYSDELYRVPASYHRLRVQAGIAYVTQDGQDRILRRDQEMQLDGEADVALISGIGEAPVILELFDHAKPGHFYDTAMLT